MTIKRFRDSVYFILKTGGYVAVNLKNLTVWCAVRTADGLWKTFSSKSAK